MEKKQWQVDPPQAGTKDFRHYKEIFFYPGEVQNLLYAYFLSVPKTVTNKYRAVQGRSKTERSS